jgi:hypothetical protein
MLEHVHVLVALVKEKDSLNNTRVSVNVIKKAKVKER